MAKGTSPDGNPYFREDDLMNTKGKVRLKDLPAGDIPFMLDPEHEYNKTMGAYKGQLIPIYAVNCGDKKWFKCKHVLREDPKTGAPLALCTREWVDSQQFNIGSVQEHARHGPWTMKGPDPEASKKKGKMGSFFNVKRRASTINTASATPAVATAPLNDPTTTVPSTPPINESNVASSRPIIITSPPTVTASTANNDSIIMGGGHCGSSPKRNYT